MSKLQYPLVSLHHVLTQYREYIDTPEPITYKKLSVKLYGKGVVLDDPADGSTLKMKKHQIAKAGQVILSEIWGKKGAIGLVPPEGEGALCTSHFFLFDINTELLEAQYLQAIFTANYLESQLDQKAKGTTGYAAVRPKYLLEANIPLPPLEEQRRILARIEELATAIAEARGLRKQSFEDTSIVLARSRDELFNKEISDEKMQTIENLAQIVRGSSPRPKGDLRYYGGSIPRLLIADITRDGKYVTPSIDSLTEEGAKLSRPMSHGSLVLAISGSYGLPAILAVDACIHDGFIGFKDLSSLINIDFFYQAIYWRKPYFDSVVKDSGLKNLTMTHLKKMSIPLPPLCEQHRIVDYLDDLQIKIDTLKHLQTETATELDALLPSILDKAFKGEL